MNNSTELPPIKQANNHDFLKAIYGEEHYQYTHVTGFSDDPSNIDNTRKGIAWSGGHYADRADKVANSSNQYFCISIFNLGEDNKARRRKALFSQCHVIVVDDVGHGDSAKVSPNDTRLLAPSYKLETSPGNEQWGYVLSTPEISRKRVDNLLDGMVEGGLCPDGSDPGMKGVTRYVRLPQGVNNKQKYIDKLGGPFDCRLNSWAPFIKYSIEELAMSFSIDLDAERQDAEEGAVDCTGHPALAAYAANFKVKSQLGPGKFDVTCPLLHEHSDNDDSGTAIFTYPDGRLGIKCHHSHGANFSGNDIMNMLFDKDPALKEQVKAFGVGFGVVQPAAPATIDNDTGEVIDSIEVLIDKFKSLKEGSKEEAEHLNLVMLEVVNLKCLPADEKRYKLLIKGLTAYTMPEMTSTIKAVKERLKARQDVGDIAHTDKHRYGAENYLFVVNNDKFLCRSSGNMISPSAFNQKLGHPNDDDSPTRSFQALEGMNVEGVTWVPCPYGESHTDLIDVSGVLMANSYRSPRTVLPSFLQIETPERFLNHAEYLIPDAEERNAILQHMAFTMQHPEVKINWQVVLFGEPGTGKDTLLYPLTQYFGPGMCQDISPEDDEANKWGDIFAKKKVLVYQEVHRPKDKKFMNDIKTKAASTANGSMKLNIKGGGQIDQLNLYSMYLFSNYEDPIHLDSSDRRWFISGSLAIKKKENSYYMGMYEWFRNGGLEVCKAYLLEMDISNFNPNQLPFHTQARKDLIENSQSDLAIQISTMIAEGLGLFGPAIPVVTAQMLQEELRTRRSLQVIGQEMSKVKLERVGANQVEGKENGHRKQVRLWANPNYLDEGLPVKVKGNWEEYMQSRFIQKSFHTTKPEFLG